jgi:hypothetical protein
MREQGVEAGRNREDATRPGGWKPRGRVARAAGVALRGKKPRESEVVDLRVGAKGIGSHSEAGRSLGEGTQPVKRGRPRTWKTTRPTNGEVGARNP